MDKTVKIRAYTDDAKNDAPRGNLTEDQNITLELAKKNFRLEEELKSSREHLTTIEQLRGSLKQEQAKSAEMAKKTAELEARIRKYSALDANELAKKSALLEDEKRKSLEHIKMIEQLRENLRQEQAKAAEMEKKAAMWEFKTKELAALEVKVKELPALEAKVKDLLVWEAKAKELSEMLGKISSLAATGKAG
ncbi:MAG: hypothetical protein FD173_1887 [Gallionellaceae bacterium]|nr:MAG: hypothetical protein FD173_1887 [Gallionellaceae bacterium]